MTNQPLSRREFIKLSGLSMGALVTYALPWPPTEDSNRVIARGRVTTRSIQVYSIPDLKGEKVGTCQRDQILPIYEECIGRNGPAYNPRWYRIKQGYVHSGHVQRVEHTHVNDPQLYIPEDGQLGEITVPFTQCQRSTRTYGWVPLYRLYYGSVHWVTGVQNGPDQKPWYSLEDELLHVQYCVPAEHVRLIQPEELTPISPHIPPEGKKIIVSILDQTLTAYEGDQVVLQTQVSTGLRDGHVEGAEIPTDTPEGQFHIQVKVPSKHMGDGHLTSDIEAYELPGVPWVSFFYASGVAFHGTYWHDNFGRRMSHGCVNMRNPEAQWLYRWSTPIATANDKNSKGWGTQVQVIVE